MVVILRFLAEYCGFLFSPDRFRFVDSLAESASGDAMVVLESGTLRLRITHDRGQLLLEFQPIHGKRSDWFSLGLLRGVLLGDRDGSEVLDPAWARFLSDSLGDLERTLADSDKAKHLIDQLKLQGRLRAKELFG
jgi:hypothetical protein